MVELEKSEILSLQPKYIKSQEAETTTEPHQKDHDRLPQRGRDLDHLHQDGAGKRDREEDRLLPALQEVGQ